MNLADRPGLLFKRLYNKIDDPERQRNLIESFMHWIEPHIDVELLRRDIPPEEANRMIDDLMKLP